MNHTELKKWLKEREKWEKKHPHLAWLRYKYYAVLSFFRYYRSWGRQLQFTYQRVFRGYDDKVKYGWGLDSYIAQIIPSLKYLCEEYLKDEERCELNPWRDRRYKKTLELIADWEKMTSREEMNKENKQTKLFAYIGKNAGWYWN